MSNDKFFPINSNFLKNFELERERRIVKGPKKSSKKTQSLLMCNRNKLKTVRAKNAEELSKQGRRWERIKTKMAEQERIDEIETRKEREKMLEDHTLYVFDPEKVETSSKDLVKFKCKKITDYDIDLKSFLLSERDNRLMKKIREEEKMEFLKAQESLKAVKQTLSVATPTYLRSQDISSFEEKQEDCALQDEITQRSSNNEKVIEDAEEIEKLKKFEFVFRRQEMKNRQSKKDEEDPQIEQFKNAETVAELYALADEIITSEARKNKLLKHIKIIKKSLKTNMALLKGAQ